MLGHEVTGGDVIIVMGLPELCESALWRQAKVMCLYSVPDFFADIHGYHVIRHDAEVAKQAFDRPELAGTAKA